MSYRSSSQALSASSASQTCTTPAGTIAGDRTLALIGDDAVGSITPNPAGAWQVIRNVGGSGVSSQIAGYYLDHAGAPAANYTFDSAGGATNINVVLVTLQPDGNTFGALTSSTVGEASSATVSNPAVDGAADPSTIVFASANDANSTIVTPPASMTLAQHADNASSELAVYYQENAGAASITKSIEWSTATGKLTFLIVQAMTAASGPTIDTQPQADTAVQGEAAQFTVEATTSGGTLVYQWQEDDGGGFANISDGGIYSGATTDTLDISAVTLSMDGYEYRVNVADDNGNVDSDAAALTVLAGNVLDPNPTDPTDADGETVVALTSDVVDDTTPGKMKLIVYTLAPGVTISTTARATTPA